MHLNDGSGITLSLTVSGYQFPAMETQPHDSNWLNVVGKVAHPRGSWSFHDPCLLTYELERLCGWLDHAAENPEADIESEYFTEPNLEFHRVEAGGRPALRIHLSHEASPPWLIDRDARLKGVELDFPIAANDLRAASLSLRKQLKKFPQRAER